MHKILRNFLTTAVFSCVLLCLMSPAFASVSGTLETGSTGTVTATLTSIIFNNDPAALGGSNFTCPPGGPCDSDVATGTALSFAGCASGILNTAGCLSTQEGIIVASPITGGSIPTNSFMTFSNNANLVFSLLGISTYTNSTCTGLALFSSCVVYPGSALILTAEPGGQTQVSLSVSGDASDTGVAGLSAPGVSTYSGGFNQRLTMNLPDGLAPTPANIQFYFCGTNTVSSVGQCLTYEAGQPGGAAAFSITSSQSGSFTASIGTTGTPEPSSWAMLLMGTGLIALAARRRKVR